MKHSVHKYFHEIHCDITKRIQWNNATFSNEIVFCGVLHVQMYCYIKEDIKPRGNHASNFIR